MINPASPAIKCVPWVVLLGYPVGTAVFQTTLAAVVETIRYECVRLGMAPFFVACAPPEYREPLDTRMVVAHQQAYIQTSALSFVVGTSAK